jgi:hypothetical protein
MAPTKRQQDFWHEQGFPAARFCTEPIGKCFQVGSYEAYNLVNGKPPHYRE